MLKLPYFGLLMQRTDSLEKTLVLGNIEDRKRRGQQGWDGWMVSLTQWARVWVSSGSRCWTWKPGMLQSMGLQRVRHDWVTEINWIFWMCDGCYRRHLCAKTEHVLQTHYASLCFPLEEQTLHFLETFFLVLWVLFPLECVLLFYVRVAKVDFCGGTLLEIINFVMHYFWKFYGNRLVFIIDTNLDQKPNGAKCEWQLI